MVEAYPSGRQVGIYKVPGKRSSSGKFSLSIRLSS